MSVAGTQLDSMLLPPEPGPGAARRYDGVWFLLPLALFLYIWTASPWAQPHMALQPLHLKWQPLLVLCSGFSLLTLAQSWLRRLPGRFARTTSMRRGIQAGAWLAMLATQAWVWSHPGPEPLFTGAYWLFVQALLLVLIQAWLKTRSLPPQLASGELTVTPLRPHWRDYLALTKMGLNGLVLFTTFVGFYMATPGQLNWRYCLITLLGTGLVAWGASTLNQFLERDVDAHMRRTSVRPLPAGRMTIGQAMAFGVALSVAGLVMLALLINILTAAVAAATLAVYLFLYTPLKRINSLSTLAGAISGALPPVIGWVATGRGFQSPALVLFAILFLWQIPHFLAIAWKYREQYASAGFAMYSRQDPTGRATGVQALLYSLVLVPISILTVAYGISGPLYLGAGALVGLGLVGCAVVFLARPTASNATRLFLATILYLPFLLGLMMFDNLLVTRFHF